jgi:hypothetical protein
LGVPAALWQPEQELVKLAGKLPEQTTVGGACSGVVVGVPVVGAGVSLGFEPVDVGVTGELGKPGVTDVVGVSDWFGVGVTAGVSDGSESTGEVPPSGRATSLGSSDDPSSSTASQSPLALPEHAGASPTTAGTHHATEQILRNTAYS